MMSGRVITSIKHQFKLIGVDHASIFLQNLNDAPVGVAEVAGGGLSSSSRMLCHYFYLFIV